ncbi:MAG: OadG family protein [Clostridia bacterium]|nr:OadG family protein [Clostridia bacterium]
MLLMIENAVGEGFRTLGIGIMIVIGVLALLMAVLYLLIPLFKKIANKKPKEKKAKKKKSPAPAEALTATPAPDPVEEDDGDIVAAIIAAIASGSGRTPSSLRVVSFKRIK